MELDSNHMYYFVNFEIKINFKLCPMVKQT